MVWDGLVTGYDGYYGVWLGYWECIALGRQGLGTGFRDVVMGKISDVGYYLDTGKAVELETTIFWEWPLVLFYLGVVSRC
jgi:hypothetical protein